MSGTSDQLVRTVTVGGDVALSAVVGTGLVREATNRREMSPTAVNALGRGLVGVVLLSVGLKGGESLQLRFAGDGPLGDLLAITDDQARVRGTIRNPMARVPPRNGRFDVGGGMGRGLLSVVRSHPNWREPHTGVVEIETGEIARDLAKYLTESEQTPAAVALGVGLDREGRVDATAGVMVRVLPGARNDVVAHVEANVASLPNVAELVRMGFDADGLLDHLARGVGVGERDYTTPRFHCPCNRQRALETLGLLGSEAITEIVELGQGQEVCCHFCGLAYQLTSDEVRAHYAH